MDLIGILDIMKLQENHNIEVGGENQFTTLFTNNYKLVLNRSHIIS